MLSFCYKTYEILIVIIQVYIGRKHRNINNINFTQIVIIFLTKMNKKRKNQ